MRDTRRMDREKVRGTQCASLLNGLLQRTSTWRSQLLREFDRCRVLYEKFLEFNPANCTTWIKYAELETALGDVERSRAIYELAVGQEVLDMPEIVWKAYIDFEAEQEQVSAWISSFLRDLCLSWPFAAHRWATCGGYTGDCWSARTTSRCTWPTPTSRPRWPRAPRTLSPAPAASTRTPTPTCATTVRVVPLFPCCV